jgi:hypoxanthine phosphoribosyltransferase
MTQPAMQKLLSPRSINKRVKQIGADISKEYRGKTVTVVGVLNGASIFTTDLVKNITVPVEMGFMQVSSYGDSRHGPTKAVEIDLLPNIDVAGKHILLCEDVLDSGNSLDRIREVINALNPASFKICVFADKGLSKIRPHFIGFKVPSHRFLVGYGMDDGGLQRNLTGVFTVG